MKKTIGILMLVVIFFFPIRVYASSASVEIDVQGDIKTGEEIKILVNMKGLEGLYAASVDFSYDKNYLNILNIAGGDSIKQYKDEIMEIGGEVDTDNNKTSYSFTFLGDKKGINGDGTLAIIKAKVINGNNLNIGQDNIKVKLIKRLGDSVDNYDYNFIGCNKEISIENEKDKLSNENLENNISSDNSNIENNISSDNSNTENNNTSTNEEGSKNGESTESDVESNINGEENLVSNKEENYSENSDTIKSNNQISNVNDGNIQISKNNSNNLVYIVTLSLILLVAILSGIYCYFKFIKSKDKNN